MPNFTPENFRPEIFTPKAGLKFFTFKQDWKLSHLKQPENFNTCKLDLFIDTIHVPSQTIKTWRPSFAIPHIFHTGNKSSSNQFILTTNHVWSRVEVHNISPWIFSLFKCILISSWLVYYNLILHVVLYHNTFILPLSYYRRATKIVNNIFRKSDIYHLFILLEHSEKFSVAFKSNSNMTWFFSPIKSTDTNTALFPR